MKGQSFLFDLVISLVKLDKALVSALQTRVWGLNPHGDSNLKTHDFIFLFFPFSLLKKYKLTKAIQLI